MGRFLAIDYGTKRTGLAVSDILKIIANGLTTVATHTLFDYLKTYLEREDVEKIIVGLPKQMNNEYSENMKHIRPFVKKLQTLYPNIPIELYDERFTSALAQKAIIDAGLKKKDRQNKALVDEVSAVIILQSYMESLRLQNK
ncbi:putative Holliday junction resolvase [Dysgonomonas sp. PFB1-18]|uniref:Holliday junction resolvase RuvX n=1 Tax=unclassified Dysgonomonas TaxID=2630389 RepID=UPI002475DCAE|nr:MULTISPECIES: Holliday junction resolvase RuvX [unclassified Dysgonomonas]MDL2303144.1 Holliday junction resolvase RuvX [Dysgonomonas sp. OttesenSCG-928-D17]MDH6308168.1 putative Holliday junction resolvase [Dysgonomonas sp. PF1-14]MDH6338393.1 putative Holliday junction resolvase [Dysgonomonas sp. PF1-16]MDH6379890.1 putative Holliday junction resolvase [Dysgonomonas sp. PFB1-18]MDH6397020.1 putative Holliday junction resolvase [Dysgonomonas sp. PF1-23]